MSLLYNGFILKFINICIYINIYTISLSLICQSGYKLLVLSLLFCGCQRLLLPTLTYQWFHLLVHRRSQPSSRDSIYSASGLCFSDFNNFFLWVFGLHAGVRLGCVNLVIERKERNLPQPEWMCSGKLLGTLPSPELTVTLHAEELVWKWQNQVPLYLRCQESSLFSCLSK